MTGEQKPVLIVIDDEPGILEVVGRYAARAGFEVIACAGGREGIAKVQSTHADLVMVDLRMPDIGGIEVLRAIRDSGPACEVVLMSGYATIDSAVEAVKLGARDYLTKPLDFERVQRCSRSCGTSSSAGAACCRSSASREAPRVQRHDRPRPADAGRVLADPPPRAARAHRADHRRDRHRQGAGRARAASTGPAARRRFVTVNCSAVVETLFESELFGHVRGAFTGATEHKAGLFEAAARRHAVPRRDWRAAAVAAGEAAAGARERRGAARRRRRAAASRRARVAATNRDLRSRSGRRPVPLGPAVPAERRRGGAAAAAATGGKTSRT